MWTEKKIQTLMKMWNDGCTAKQIGKELECSRNAVVGKILRLRQEGIPMRNIETTVHHVVAKKSFKPTPPSMPEPSPPAPQQGLKTLLDLRAHDCRWPLGAMMDRPHFFCGAPSVDGSPYCQVHTNIARPPRRNQ